MKLDFTNCPVQPLKLFDGANGKKISILYNDKMYMLKFPPKPSIANSELEYSNSCFSEYIGCHIFNILEIPAQETLLGVYNIKKNGKDNFKIVVICEDFEKDGFQFKNFAALKNSIIDSPKSGYGTEIDDILLTINEQNILPPKTLIRSFWNMFIIDTYIGNFDRHNGNWGVLTNLQTGKVKLAPIFDCSSSLFAQASDKQMQNVLNDDKALEYRVYSVPRSALEMGGIRINPYEFLLKTDNKECLKALDILTSKIQTKETAIERLINHTPYISDIHKNFIITILKKRFENILLKAYKKHKKFYLSL